MMGDARTKRIDRAALLALLLAAAFLRLYRLDEVPPGWRDDELINSLVISQHVLDGDWAVFYPDASGHESLYHVLNAGMMALFGPGVGGIRWLSVILGVLSVALTFLLARQLFGRPVGFVAATALALGFWSLMYSRVGLRHVSLLPLMLGAFAAFWRGIRINDELHETHSSSPGRWYFCLAGALLGISFYTYFASRGLPLILVALAAYWLLFDRPALCRHWRGLVLALAVAAALAVPLLLAQRQTSEMTGRVEEIAVPLARASEGDFEPLLRHARITLGMFHADGDDEWLYNIPHRPVFDLFGALLFVSGLLISLYRALPFGNARHKTESAFLLLWLAAGLFPGFISVPPASLGHTIVAQPAVYMLPAIAIAAVGEWGRRWVSGGPGVKRPDASARWAAGGGAVLAALFLVSSGARDLNDYLAVWPERGMVRLLYRADIRDAAQYLNDHSEISDVAFAGSLAGPWDRQALLVDLARPLSDRWFDPRRALVYPSRGGHLILTGFPELGGDLQPFLEQTGELVADQGTFQIYSLRHQPVFTSNGLLGGQPVSFDNGLLLVHLERLPAGVLTGWQALSPPFGLPAFTLVSNPPPPGVETRPRLAVFVHWLDASGAFVDGDDGLWVDPYSLQAGDMFLQFHRLHTLQADADYQLQLGLYDPVTGDRVSLSTGGDRLLVGLTQQ